MFEENIHGSTLEIEPVTRQKSGKIVGYGIWLTQGSAEHPTEYWIPYSELDDYILALQKARKCIEEKMK